ncbi:hypothetical protein ACROYT_G021420 [Oculina patagonica]
MQNREETIISSYLRIRLLKMMLLVYIVVLGITGNLAVNGQPYGPWSDWSECTVDEGQGVMRRTRECIVDVCPEPGEYLDFMACFVITKPCECECPPFPAAPGTDEPSTVSTGTIKIELSEEPTTIEANVTEAPGQEVSTSTIQIELSEEPTTAAPEATTAAVENATTPSEEEVTTEVIDIGLIEETTTAAPESNTTSAPEISTTSAPESNATSASELNTTNAPEITTTGAPEISTTSAPELSTTSAPEINATNAPEITSTSAPEITTSNELEITTTSAPEINATNAPELTSTSAPEINATSAPEVSTTSAPENTTTNAPEESTTSAPEISTTSAPEINSTSVPEISTTSEENSTGTTQLETNPAVTEETEPAIGAIKPTTETPAEIPCEDNALGAAVDGTLPSSSFTASSSFGEFVPSYGRLNGPLAWCSEGDSAGQEYLQIHVPEAEVICAIAIQGTGYERGHEYVRDYYIEYSEDGIGWQVYEEDGNLKVFKGNDDSKSTSKQVLPVPVEATYIRIYPMQYEGWICMRAELYGKGITQQAPFPTVPEETTAAPSEETTAAPPATEETTTGPSEETTAASPATEETTASPSEETTATPTTTEESTAAPSEEPTASPAATEESTAAQSEETTAAPTATEESTAAPSEETTSAPPEETTAATSEETTEETTEAPTEEEFTSSGKVLLIINITINCLTPHFLFPSVLKIDFHLTDSFYSKEKKSHQAPLQQEKKSLQAPLQQFHEETTAAPNEETTTAPPEETTAAPSEETTAASPGPESEQPTTVQEEASTPPPPVTPPIPTTPKRRGMDIGILIDSSFGVAADGRDASFRRREFGVYETITFDRLKSFVSELVISINEHFEDVNFGIIVYSDIPELVMTLQDAERVDVPSVIDGIRYIPGGHRTDLAMLYASRKLFCPEGCDDRPDEDNVMIVFTSENTDAESLPYSFVSPIMKNCTSNIIAVGISNEVSKSELVKIALGSKERVLKVVSPDDLDAGIINQIEEMIAEGPIVPTTQGAIAEEEEEPTTGGLVHFRT